MYLTKRQKEILDLVSAHVARHGYAPTLEEIGAYFGLKSPATVYKHVQKLVQKGYLRKAPHQGRGLQLVDPRENPSLEVPVLAAISAGEPLLPLRPADTVLVPASLHSGAQLFALRVRDDSLVDASVVGGDLLIVEERSGVRESDTVIGVLASRAAHLLRVERTDGQVQFAALAGPEKPAQRLRLRPDDVEVRGILVALLRRYERATPTRAR